MESTWRRCPVGGDERVYGEIVHPASAPERPRPNAVKREAETVGDGPASGVLRGSTDLHLRCTPFTERLIDQCPADARCDSAALDVLDDPVSERCRLTLGSEARDGRGAHQVAQVFDCAPDDVALAVLGLHTPQGYAFVFERLDEAERRYPSGEMLAIGVDQLEEGCGVAHVEWPERHFFVNEDRFQGSGLPSE